MKAIPADIRAAARHAFDEARTMSIYDTQVLIIARAILAERERATLVERERCARIVDNYKRDASFDDSMVGAQEHNSNEANIARAIRGEPHHG